MACWAERRAALCPCRPFSLTRRRWENGDDHAEETLKVEGWVRHGPEVREAESTLTPDAWLPNSPARLGAQNQESDHLGLNPSSAISSLCAFGQAPCPL